MKTIRVYTTIKNVHTVDGWVKYEKSITGIDMYEIAYIDYDVETARIIGAGTEDFSKERKRNLTVRYVGVFREIVNPETGRKKTESIVDLVNGKLKALEYLIMVNKKDNRKVFPLYRNMHKEYGNIVVREFGKII